MTSIDPKTLNALTQLLKDGAITQDVFVQSITQLTQKVARSTFTLFELNFMSHTVTKRIEQLLKDVRKAKTQKQVDNLDAFIMTHEDILAKIVKMKKERTK